VQGVGGPAFSGAFASPAFAGFTGQTAYQFGGSFNAGFAKFFAQYGSINTSATKNVTTKIYNLSATVPLGAGSLIAEYGNSKRTIDTVAGDVVSTMATGGYDYFLSKRTDIYAVVMFDKLTNTSHGSSYAVGLKHTF
jgi:predicted porin